MAVRTSRFNLVIPITAALIVVTVLSTCLSYFQTRRQISEMFDAKGNTISDFIQHASMNYLVNYDLTAMSHFLTWAQRDPQVEYASILLEGKNIIDGTRDPADYPSAIVYERAMITPEGQLLGIFKVGYKRSVFQEAFLKSLATTLLFVFLSIAMVSGVLIWTYYQLADRIRVVSSQLLNSSSRLVETARSVETASVTLKMGHQSQALVLQRANAILGELRKTVGSSFAVTAKSQPVLAANATWREVVESLQDKTSFQGESIDEVSKTVEILDELIQKTLSISTEYSAEASKLAEQADHIRNATSQLAQLTKID